MTNQEKVVWKNTFIAMAVATVEIGGMLRDNLTQSEKKALNDITKKFEVMLRSFDRYADDNPSYQMIVTEYVKFSQKVFDLQMNHLNSNESLAK